jgi:hypothetical protein
MTEQLQHDPRTKQQIKNALYLYLYTPVEAEFKRRLDALIVRNAVASGHSHRSFMYKNVLYNCDPLPLPRKMNRLALHLQPEMNEYLKEVKQLNEKEVPYVLGYITQVLNSSNDLCDYYRLLPESVHNPIRQLLDTCPCKSRKLPDEAVAMLQDKNKLSIELMKTRMVTNLLI